PKFLPPGYEFDTHGSSDETLRDHLIWQREMTYFSDTDRVIASSIIDSIRDDGYLSSPVEEIWESLHTPDNGLELDEVEAVLRQIQNFDPPGVAARDLSDCLSIQLRQLPTDTPWLAKALELVGDYLNVWAGRDYNALQKRLHLDRDELQAVVDLVHTLNPRPGSQIDSSPPEYIIPDVIVTQRKGAWHVELNPDAMPRVRINASYASLVRRGDDSAANESMRKHLNEARWFIKSLKSRSETLLKVSTCIVERQQGFLEHGDEAMKPMVLHDIAEAVSMHESTISRVTTRKYMHTPRGIFELKYFFSSQVATDSGGGASSTAIRAIIKKLIADENPGKPLSDSKLATKLSEHGIKVARRTIAKYRESMAIPSSSERKQLV
ncbi:MAG: RNA polymerase factor sigma-54, partial [Pseudomonadota bacterium]